MYKYLFFSLLVLLIPFNLIAQVVGETNDTFFLAKKKGILGKLGKSIATNPPSTAPPIKSVDPFKDYAGKFIRYIEVVSVGFNQSLNDTTEIRKNLAIQVANKLHRNTREVTIRKNLFFKEGDVLLPLLIADNERFLREQPFISDAVIVVYKSIMYKDSVDIIILTKDVFSIAGNFSINGSGRVKTEVREENLVGTGSRLSFSSLYDKKRNPDIGFGAEFIERNIKGTFLSGSLGFKTFKNAIVNNRFEENAAYIKLEKPLINRYTEWTGAFMLSLNQSTNGYLDSTQYKFTSQYRYKSGEIWGGYNIGWGRKRTTDSEKRLRHFVAARVFYNYFDKVPVIFKDSFNYNYANLNGLLVSYSLYKQNFYRSKFIYGFGRNEDIPIGINASVTAGWTNKQGRLRGYYGAEFDASHYSQRGFFSAYTARVGAYRGVTSFEDIGLLMSINHFTKLRQLNPKWLNRNFLSLSYTRLFERKLNEPIKLQSDFGLPYFRTDSLNFLEAVSRATFKFESVFFNLNKYLGFRFAPFIFTEVSFLKPVVNPTNKTDQYTSLGAGIRTRNENLVLGTIELRAYYFPQVVTIGMSRWKFAFTSNLRFKYNSTLVSKPDIVGVN